MADVVVNIRGNADQLRRELEDIETNPPQPSGRQPDNTRPAPAAPDSRLIDEVREEIERQRREGANARTSVENAGQNQRERIDNDVTQRYDARRADMQRRAGSEYESIDAEIERMRQQSYSNAGSGADDPIRRNLIDQQTEAERERRYREAGERYDSEEEQLNVEEKGERSQAEQELTKVLEELVAQMKRQGEGGEGVGTSDSFLGRLRDQRKQLIAERESAMDEAGVADAQSRLNLVDEQLRRTLNNGTPQQGMSYGKLAGGIGMAAGVMGSVQQGDISGTLMGAGSSAALLGANPYVAAAMIAAGAIGKATTYFSSQSEGLSDISRYRVLGSGNISGTRNEIGSNITDRVFGINAPNLGLDAESFGSEAAQRMRNRRMSEDWFQETISQISLERSLGLNQGALSQGSQYDRYGQNVTDAVSRLVTSLSSIEGSGVSFDDFSRVQEKFDIQQQIMGGYMNRTDKPDYDTANRLLTGFSSVQGITQDSRIGTDIQQMQSMVQNPMNDRMKALVYGTVADLFPASGGDMASIDRELRNTKNEPEIIQAVIQRISSQFGDPKENGMGYWAFKSLLPGIAPDRIDQYVSAANSGTLAESGLDTSNLLSVSDKNKGSWMRSAAGYTPEIEQYSKQMKDTLFQIYSLLNNYFGKGSTKPNIIPKGTK